MSITAVIVVMATIWFIALLVVLPIGIETQGERGEVVPGTPESAPVNPMLRKKLVWASIAALVIGVPLCGTIIYGGITMKDIDIWGLM